MLLLLALLLARPVADAVPRDFGALTEGQALALDGRRCVFRVTIDSQPDEFVPFIHCDNVSVNEVQRSLRLYAGQELAYTMLVEATLRVVRYPAIAGLDGLGRKTERDTFLPLRLTLVKCLPSADRQRIVELGGSYFRHRITPLNVGLSRHLQRRLVAAPTRSARRKHYRGLAAGAEGRAA